MTSPPTKQILGCECAAIVKTKIKQSFIPQVIDVDFQNIYMWKNKNQLTAGWLMQFSISV